MRIQPWISVIASVVMLVAAQSTSWGQAPPQGGGMMYQQPYGNTNPGAIWPAGTPASYQPYPQVSPFHSANIAQDTHYNKNGTWFRELLHRRRTYFASMEAMQIWYRDGGNSTIGSPYAQLATFGDGNPLGVPINSNNVGIPVVPNQGSIPGFFGVDTRVYPFPALDSQAFNEITFGRNPIRDAGETGEPDAVPGVQLRWGFANEDGTGLMVNGWWGGEGGSALHRGMDTINGVPVTQALTTVLGGQNLSTLLGSVPLDNGEGLLGFPDFGTGSTAKYDVLFRIEHKTQAGGTNISLYEQPLYDVAGIKLRPSWGARYLYIGEKFRFTGIDSGFNYEIDDQSDDGLFRPEPNSLELLYDQYTARLGNDIQSHLAGPEIGIRFDLGEGSDTFSMWGESNLTIAVNYEEIHLRGDHIGDPLVDARFVNIGNPRLLDPLNDTTFDTKKSSAHLSPIFQQSIFAELKLFNQLPVLKKMSTFDDASLRLGYTFLYAGGISRPADSIKWQGFPLFPEIKEGRDHWWAHTFNASIDWTY